MATDIFNAIRQNDFDQVKALVKENPQIVNSVIPINNLERTPLISSLSPIDAKPKIARFLLCNNADVNKTINAGAIMFSPVARAIQIKNIEILKRLLNRGANPNQPLSNLTSEPTVLDIALQSNDVDIIKLLLDKGASKERLAYLRDKYPIIDQQLQAYLPGGLASMPQTTLESNSLSNPGLNTLLNNFSSQISSNSTNLNIKNNLDLYFDYEKNFKADIPSTYKDEQKQFLYNLSERDLGLFKLYTFTGDRILNGVLRSNIEDIKNENPVFFSSLAAFEKAYNSLPKKGGEKVSNLIDQFQKSGTGSIRSFINEFLNLFKKVPVLKEQLTVYRGIKRKEDINIHGNEFLSTSYSEKIAKNFSGLRETLSSNNNDKCCMLTITVNPGVQALWIQPISHFRNEGEILIGPPFKIQISEDSTKKGYYNVTISPINTLRNIPEVKSQTYLPQNLNYNLLSQPIQNAINEINQSSRSVILTLENPIPQLNKNIIRQIPISNYEYNASTTAFDSLMFSDELIDTIIEDDDNLVIGLQSSPEDETSFASMPRSQIINEINDGSGIRYVCRRELFGAAIPTNVYADNPLYYLFGPGGSKYCVLISDIIQILNSPTTKAIKLIKSDISAEYTSSFESILNSNNQTFLGNDTTIISGDHCQENTSRNIYYIEALNLVKKTGGRKTRRSLKSKKRNTRRRSTSY